MNVLSFEYQAKEIPLSIYKEPSDSTIPIHRSLFTHEFWETVDYEFDEVKHLHCAFALDDEAQYSFSLEMKSFAKLSKHYFNTCLVRYFQSVDLLAFDNFVNDVEVWIPDNRASNQQYTFYNKFTLRPMYGRVSDGHELMVSFDGVSQVFNTSLEDLNTVPVDLFSSVINQGRIRSLKSLSPEDKTYLSDTYPLMNLGIKKHLGIKLDGPDKSNKYKKYKGHIDKFYSQYLNTDEFKATFHHQDIGYHKLPPHKVRRTHYDSNTLRFANGKTNVNPYIGMTEHGPYAPSPHSKVVFFFIFRRQDFEIAKDLNSYLLNGYKHFKGLKAFIKQPFDTEPKSSLAFDNIMTVVSELKVFLAKKEYKADTRYVGLYITPVNKFEEDQEQKEVYYKVKEQLLKHNVTSQAIYRENITKTDFNYALPNISVALLAKLDGIPWRLDRKQSDELIVGVGAFAPTSKNQRYVGSAFCFTNEGTFHGFDCFSSDEINLLAASIREAILTYLIKHKEAKRLIIHFYKTMSQKEIKPILEVLDLLGIKIPVVIVTINKTISNDFVGFDTADPNLMPVSGSFIKIGYNRYILFNNSRYYKNTYKLRIFPFPIKLSFQCTEEGYLDDYQVVLTLIDQVYQFSRMYWKSVSQQNLPVTIKYSEMVAKIFPHFDGDIIPDFGKTNLWFL